MLVWLTCCSGRQLLGAGSLCYYRVLPTCIEVSNYLSCHTLALKRIHCCDDVTDISTVHGILLVHGKLVKGEGWMRSGRYIYASAVQIVTLVVGGMTKKGGLTPVNTNRTSSSAI